MDSLNQILAISDSSERVNKLLALARSLGVNTAKAKTAQGEIQEHKLVVLIFDELGQQQRRKRQRLVAGVLTVIIFIFGTIAMYAISQLVLSMRTSIRGPLFDEAE